ncbi:MAG: hypothetical protein EHM21_02030 [Chloroflexi bacterium]|nr:MAG: hypothetical protein EHM21_02030 [Chloroflexota bacterium]
MPLLRVGCGLADITPPLGTPLSGFIARENKPSERIEDRIFVRALAIRTEGEISFLLNYEVLGLKADLVDRIRQVMENDLQIALPEQCCVITATHTHSSVPLTPLEGEVDVDPAYIPFLLRQTVNAARQALDRCAPANLHVASQHIAGLTYNRRALLEDGRVSMALEPDAPVLVRGPVDDLLTLLVWKNPDTGSPLAGMVHFACHGVALCTQAISGDIPGQIMQHFEHILQAPCLFLQGASGDVNPIAAAGERPAMLNWCAAFASQVGGLTERLQPAQQEPFVLAALVQPLEYQQLPQRAQVEQAIQGYKRIALGQMDPSDAVSLQLLADLMNTPPGQLPDPTRAAFSAAALANAGRRVLQVIDSGQPPEPCPLHMTGWRLGDLLLVFSAAELFTVTGLSIRGLNPQLTILPVTHAAPIVGYVPDAGSIRQGGYEVKDAWQFYRQPAPFSEGAEASITAAVGTLVATIKGEAHILP